MLSHYMQDDSEGQEPLHLEPLLQQRENICSLTRKHCLSSLELSNSSSSCTVDSSSSTQITSHSSTLSMRQRQCLSWHLHWSNGELSPSAPTRKPSSTRLVRIIPMRIASVNCPIKVPKPGETILLMGYPAASPVSATHIRQHHDPTPSNVRGFVQRGWPDELPVTSDMQ